MYESDRWCFQKQTQNVSLADQLLYNRLVSGLNLSEMISSEVARGDAIAEWTHKSCLPRRLKHEKGPGWNGSCLITWAVAGDSLCFDHTPWNSAPVNVCGTFSFCSAMVAIGVEKSSYLLTIPKWKSLNMPTYQKTRITKCDFLCCAINVTNVDLCWFLFFVFLLFL